MSGSTWATRLERVSGLRIKTLSVGCGTEELCLSEELTLVYATLIRNRQFAVRVIGVPSSGSTILDREKPPHLEW